VTAVTRRDTVITATSSALQTIASIDNSILPSDTEVPQSIVLLLHARVRHRSDPGPLLGQAQVVGPAAGPSRRLDGLRPRVVWTPVPEDKART